LAFRERYYDVREMSVLCVVLIVQCCWRCHAGRLHTSRSLVVSLHEHVLPRKGVFMPQITIGDLSGP